MLRVYPGSGFLLQVCNLASIALPRFVKDRIPTSESQGRPKLIGSHNAANR